MLHLAFGARGSVRNNMFLMVSQTNKYCLLLLIMISCIGCLNRPDQKSSDNQAQEEKTDLTQFVHTSYFTSSGKKLTLIENRSMGSSVVELSILTELFTNANDSIGLGSTDPVDQVFVTDLDGNGYEEFLIVTRSVGSGSYASLYGFASNNDKSVSMIHVPELIATDFEPGGHFEGFMGHNKFHYDGTSLTNSFPNYSENDSNASPSGGRARVSYQLIAGEASWILKPVKRTNLLQQ